MDGNSGEKGLNGSTLWCLEVTPGNLELDNSSPFFGERSLTDVADRLLDHKYFFPIISYLGEQGTPTRPLNNILKTYP